MGTTAGLNAVKWRKSLAPARNRIPTELLLLLLLLYFKLYEYCRYPAHVPRPNLVPKAHGVIAQKVNYYVSVVLNMCASAVTVIVVTTTTVISAVVKVTGVTVTVVY
jgi:hypothetical protein